MNRRLYPKNAYKGGRKFDTRNYFRNFRWIYGDLVTEKQFREILVDELMYLFNERMMRYMRVKLPYRMGEMYIERVKGGFEKNYNGEMERHDLVDWKKTWELWNYDPTAPKRGLAIYQDLSSFAIFRYKTPRQCFKNSAFYDLVLCKELRLRIYKELTHNNTL